MTGTRFAATKDDPSFRPLKKGTVVGDWLILRATAPQFSKYLGEWFVDYESYVIPPPCQCCGKPRGAGTLHP